MLFKFYLDQEGERKTLQYMFHGWSGNTVEQRANQYGIPVEIAKKCEGKTRKCKELLYFLAHGYEMYAKELKQSLAFHKKYWQENGARITKKLESVFGHKIPTYTVRLNSQCDGISNWSGTDISINAFSYLYQNKSYHVQVILWETVLSLTFIDMRKKYSKDELSDNQVWGIAELTADSFVQIDFEKSDWNIGYPELEPRRQKAKKMYRDRKNFVDYLDKMADWFMREPLKKGCM